MTSAAGQMKDCTAKGGVFLPLETHCRQAKRYQDLGLTLLATAKKPEPDCTKTCGQDCERCKCSIHAPNFGYRVDSMYLLRRNMNEGQLRIIKGLQPETQSLGQIYVKMGLRRTAG